jgi:hypothetical protein
MSETALRKEIEHTLEIYEKLISHAASRTRPMFDRYPSEIEALSHLVISPDLQYGFKVLRDRGMLDKTFEAVVVRFKHLFRPEIVEAAEWRLAHAHDLG